MDFIIELWEHKRWLFWLLLPVIAVIFALHFFINAKAEQAKDSVDKATKADDALKTKINEIKVEEAKVETTIAVSETKLAERKVEEIPLDWNKTFKQEDK